MPTHLLPRLNAPTYTSIFSSSSHVWIWELNYKESWLPKNWCFWTVVLEKTLVSPLDCKEIQPVHSRGIQSWIFTGRTDAEAETPILWPPDAKNWLIWKDPDAGKDWRQEEKRMTEDEMVWWHHRLHGHKCEQAPGVGNGQGSLASIGSQRVECDWVTELNWTDTSKFEKVLCMYQEPPLGARNPRILQVVQYYNSQWVL